MPSTPNSSFLDSAGRIRHTLACLALAFLPVISPAATDSAKAPSAATEKDSTTYEQPVDYSRGTRVRLGGISLGAGATFANGPYWGPGWYGSGWYGPRTWNSLYWDPWFASPYGPAWGWPAMGWVHPGYWGGFARTPAAGEVELHTPSKDDIVMVDGAYAGPAKNLKSFWLEPGVYVIAVAGANGNSFERKIYVLSGKTLRIQAKLSPPVEADNPPAPPTANGAIQSQVQP